MFLWGNGAWAISALIVSDSSRTKGDFLQHGARTQQEGEFREHLHYSQALQGSHTVGEPIFSCSFPCLSVASTMTSRCLPFRWPLSVLNASPKRKRCAGEA